MDDLRVAFARRVRALRHERGFSQEELAHRAGLHYTYVTAYDVGRVELYIYRSDQSENKAIFDELQGNSAAIEKAFGGPLKWQRIDDKSACRISSCWRQRFIK